jgi:ATP-dependent DNA helicase RecQ
MMPTGAGKSLCYQIPALSFPGGCLVISPLIALMQDQVDALRRKAIEAHFINSTVSRDERERRLDEFVRGNIKLLYVTPERFRKKEFIAAIQSANIDLLAVDEAHCISEWGHDFRPDYSRIGEFRELIGNPLTIALTATATPEVQKDIVAKLNIKPENITVFHEGICRPNLRLETREAFDEKEKLKYILDVLDQYDGCGIIYFALIQTLDKFSIMLERLGLKHSVYHGKLPDNQRRKVQRAFMGGKEKLILATNAFGMGVDKPDIRFVIHAEVPSSVESYYQEIGRAGRDGEPSLCVLLYSQDDLYTQMEFIKWANPSGEYYHRLYNILQANMEKANSLGIEYLREQMSFKDKNDFRLETALAMMERYGITEGAIDTHNLELCEELPEELSNDEYIKKKLKNDNMKLLSVVKYFREEGCRRVFVSDYFGFPGEPECGNCDNCGDISKVEF